MKTKDIKLSNGSWTLKRWNYGEMLELNKTADRTFRVDPETGEVLVPARDIDKHRNELLKITVIKAPEELRFDPTKDKNKLMDVLKSMDPDDVIKLGDEAVDLCRIKITAIERRKK